MFYVPYVPSPHVVVREMLRLANVSQRDIVYDLGCGDGRILISAVKEFRASRAVGIENDSERARATVRNAAYEGVGERVLVIQGDFFDVDISPATVVTMFLLTSVNEALRPKLEKELRRGTRVVSHEFRIPGWREKKRVEIVDDNGLSHVIYLYLVGEH